MNGPHIINLIGGRGYTGSELLRIIAGHPSFNLGVASSRSTAGQSIHSICADWPDDGSKFTIAIGLART